MKGLKGFQKGNKLAERKGKHKKTLEVEAARERLKSKVFQELDPILDAQIDLAKGHLIEEYHLEGKRVYAKSPDKGAAEMLLNQAIGKAKETLEHLGEIVVKDLTIDE